MGKSNSTGQVVAVQGNGIHISKGSANGGPTLAELCAQLGGEAGTTLENSAKPPSIKAPKAQPQTPRFPFISVIVCVVIAAVVVYFGVLP